MPMRPAGGPVLNVGAIVFAAALFVELVIAFLGSEPAGDRLRRRAVRPRPSARPGQIGELLLTKFLLPFEVASFLLLIAAVGAVVLARRRGGIARARRGDSRWTARARSARGTMAEGVGVRRPPAVPRGRRARRERGGW